MSFGRTATLILGAAAIAAGLGLLAIRHLRHSETIPDHPRGAPGVVMRDVSFFSRALRREMPYRVFLPQSGGGEHKLPVVYLLHGGGGGFRDWSNNSDVSRFALRNLILVMPEGGSSYYTNAALVPQDRYEDYVVDDLIADVTKQFAVREDRGGRAIVGVSMGGFGAIRLALRHPEKFAFVAGLSPAIDAPRRRFTWRRLEQSRHFRQLFGPEGGAARSDNDPFLIARAADPEKIPYLYLACGQAEGLMAPNREFAQLLTRYSIAHEFHEAPGGHNWNQWNGELAAVFRSLAQHLVIGAGHPGASERLGNP